MMPYYYSWYYAKDDDFGHRVYIRTSNTLCRKLAVPDPSYVRCLAVAKSSIKKCPDCVAMATMMELGR